jgi:simple sugar transport system substrate-binding protein
VRTTTIWSRMFHKPLARRQVLGGMALGAMAPALPSVLAACASSSSGGGVGNFPNHPPWNFVFVNHGTISSFFVPTQYGIQDACALVGCTFQWAGSSNGNVDEMVSAFNRAIRDNVDGIAISIVNATAFDTLTQQALSQGIPVVSYNADTPNVGRNGRLAYIGQDLFQVGYAMGKRVLSLIPEGNIAAFIPTPGSLNAQPRVDGLKQAIADAGAPLTVTEVGTGTKAPDQLAAVESYYSEHSDVKGLFAVNASNTQAVGQIMQKYGLAAKGIYAGGYDLLPQTLQYIKSGDLHFTIDQQAYLQGFQTVMELFLFKLSGGLSRPANINTGLVLVTQANVDPYLNTKTRFEGSSAKQQVVSS